MLIFLSTGPVNSSILGLVPPSMRATSMALSILAIHVLGDVLAADGLVGALSRPWISCDGRDDHPRSRSSIGGLIWLYAAWQGERHPPRGAAA